MQEIKSKQFSNGCVYALSTKDGYPVEVTDTFLPYYTKNAICYKQNSLMSYDVGSRDDRWMIGVSCMSGCPVKCKFCATGQLKKVRMLSSEEIIDQVKFVLNKNINRRPSQSKEFKINYTRMGEPFLNIEAIKSAIQAIDSMLSDARVHHYISTIGVEGADYGWIKDNITLQLSLHSLKEEKRNWLIPFQNKISIEELGEIRTNSNLKTTINMTLVDESDFDIDALKQYFDNQFFFVKISPINPNCVSEQNEINSGVIQQKNLK